MTSTEPPTRAVEYTPTDDYGRSVPPPPPPIRVSRLIDDYDVVVIGLAHLFDPYADRIVVAELDTNEPLTDTVDIALYDSFAQPEADHDDIGVLVRNPCARYVVACTPGTSTRPSSTTPSPLGPPATTSKTLPARQLVAALRVRRRRRGRHQRPATPVPRQRGSRLARTHRGTDRPRSRGSSPSSPKARPTPRSPRSCTSGDQHRQDLRPLRLPEDRRHHTTESDAVGHPAPLPTRPPPPRPLARWAVTGDRSQVGWALPGHPSWRRALRRRALGAGLCGEAQCEGGGGLVGGELMGLAGPQVDDLAVVGAAAVCAQWRGEVVHVGIGGGCVVSVVVMEAVANAAGEPSAECSGKDGGCAGGERDAMDVGGAGFGTAEVGRSELSGGGPTRQGGGDGGARCEPPGGDEW